MVYAVVAILLSILLSAIAGFCVVHLGNLVEFKGVRDVHSVKITFNSFITLYSIAPSNWELHRYYVHYRDERTDFHSYHDYRKYTRWKKQLDNHKIKQSVDMNTVLMIKCWQKDIDNYSAKHEKEAIDMLKDLCKE